jgi:D-sedoheptulose 7-phosphate isomerase
MDLSTFFAAEFAEHADVTKRTQAALAGEFAKLVQVCVQSLRNGGKLMLFGNGGSAADAQHLAAELTIRYRSDRPAIAALALTTDTSALTAAGNDIGFENIFARQMAALGKAGDVAIGISTSGKSANVLAGLRRAREMKIVTVGLSGRTGGGMAPVCDHLICVPSDTTARIQEMHILLGQMLCGAIEIELGLVR